VADFIIGIRFGTLEIWNQHLYKWFKRIVA